VKYLTLEDGVFIRNYCFRNGYILFSSLRDREEEVETPDNLYLRMYNENLDYIDFDASGNGFPYVFTYPISTENKAGIFFKFCGWGGRGITYITSYLFDFENRKVLRPHSSLVSFLYNSFVEDQYATSYTPVVTDDFVQKMFWGIRQLNYDYYYFSDVYPIYNPVLFFKAAELVQESAGPGLGKKEQGAFSYTTEEYYFPKAVKFFFEYDRNALTQDSAKTGSYGIKLHESFMEVLLETDISANAFLTEGTTEYRAENMRVFSGRPWSVKNTELAGAEIVLETSGPVNWLVIGNGFYHAERPDLYKKNSRPREILIAYETGPSENGASEKREHRVILADTFEMQFVPLLYMDRKKIHIKILSVYPGTDYDDTCLNYIGALGDPSLMSTKWWK
jgi:hypothetical protein